MKSFCKTSCAPSHPEESGLGYLTNPDDKEIGNVDEDRRSLFPSTFEYLDLSSLELRVPRPPGLQQPLPTTILR